MSDSGGGVTEIRYAGYIEDAHGDLIWISRQWVQYLYDSGPNYNSPYADLTILDPDVSFLGIGVTLSDYTSLFELFNSYVSTTNLNLLYTQINALTIQNPTLQAEIVAEAAYLEDEINYVSLPKLNAGMRDINAVMSSSFIIGKAMLEQQKLKMINKFAADLKIKAMELAFHRWSKQMDWGPRLVDQYQSMLRLYWATRFDYTNVKGEIVSRDMLWPFTVLDHHRVIVAALNGAAAAQVKGESKAARAIAGLMGGAAAGAMAVPANPLLGASIGGVLGLAGGLIGS